MFCSRIWVDHYVNVSSVNKLYITYKIKIYLKEADYTTIVIMVLPCPFTMCPFTMFIVFAQDVDLFWP